MKLAQWVVLLGLATAGYANADVLPDAPHVAVHGRAERTVVPDRFKLSLTVSRVGLSTGEVRTAVDDIVAKLLSTLDSQGVDPADVSATGLRLSPQYRYDDRKQVFEGNLASRTLAVTFRDVDRLGRFIAAIPSGTDVKVEGITPTISNEEKIKKELAAEAIASSKAKAEELASAYGRSVGGVFSISDQALGTSYVTGSRSRGFDIGIVAGAPQPRLSPGTIIVSEDIYVVFLLGDR